MPVTPTYPGVYIQEVSSGVRTISGVATSITAFIGRAKRGPVNKATRIQGFSEYQNKFGGLWLESTMSYAVKHYFDHGGQDAIVVRVYNGEGGAAAITLPPESGTDSLVLEASSPGEWGNNLRASVAYQTTRDPARLFTLIVEELEEGSTSNVIASETFFNLSTDLSNPRFITNVLRDESSLVQVSGTIPSSRPAPTTTWVMAASTGRQGDPVGSPQIIGGLSALDRVDLFNLLCIPPYTRDQDLDSATDLMEAAKYCKDRRAILIVDPPSSWRDVTGAEDGISGLRAAIGNDNAQNVATFFPRLLMADPLRENRSETFVPCGAVAGIIARTDAQRGVWKAPAGLDASLAGVRGFGYKLNDGENGRLNPLALNCLRNFPVHGNAVWGARTLAGADQLGSEWKYLPVRRTALFIEESLYRGLQWVVFEPNDEPLWAQIRLNVGAFMHNLFRQGAFQGKTPREAYLVKCDKETTTQNDIDRGIVNVVVGFAPLKPAEFVIVTIQQMAGQIQV